MPKYMFLQYVDEAAAPVMGSVEKNEEIEAYGRLFQEATAAGVLRGGDACDSRSTNFSVQVRDGETRVGDGPMHAQSPWLNGYWVFECRDRAEAESWAARIPAAHGTGTVEVHPIFEFPA